MGYITPIISGSPSGLMGRNQMGEIIAALWVSTSGEQSNGRHHPYHLAAAKWK